jgi:hypothetical protein
MSDNDGIDFVCPHCQQRLNVPASNAGKKIRCPSCSNLFEVPSESGISAEPIRTRSRTPDPEPDPYEEPRRDEDDDYGIDRPRRRRASSDGGRVMAPAICMLVVAGIGLLVNLFGCVFSLVGPEQPIDPNAPPFLQEIMRSSRGPVASGMQGFFALLSALSVFGSIQMMRKKTWSLALAACILSMINIGNCCCLLGLPFGIWAMIALLDSDVKDAFS